jgi:hypothetical protein
MNAEPMIKRVFWHESGHFIAGYYNKHHYGYFGTERFTIKRVETLNQNFDYTGAHKPKEPENYVPGTPIKNPAAHVAELAYGCFLQCIYLDNPILSCFDSEKTGVHGFHDYGDVASVALKFMLSVKDKRTLYDIIYEQFELIKDNSEFKELFEISIEDLIQFDEPIIDIDPVELEKRFKNFLIVHEKTYKRFVEKLYGLFYPYLSQSPSSGNRKKM